ncbi:MAG: ABC transporter permease [Clostridiales bacterium]|nr:ABC transporter permease [Clostridiales bacterium]
MKRVFKSFKYVFLGLALLFLYIPIIYLIVFSFNDFGTGRHVSYTNIGTWNGFTLRNFLTLFKGEAGDALLLTLEIAAVSSIVATIIGTAAAIGINAMKKRTRTAILNVSQLPMVNPDLVTGITFMMLFAFVNTMLINMGLKHFQIGGFVKLLIAHISFSIPYVIFSVLPRLRQSSDMLYEAAIDLGCSPIQALFKAVIPDIMPGITSGFIMALTMSLDDFVVSYFVGDKSVLSVYIYSSFRTSGVNPAIATVLFVPLVALLLFVNLRSLAKEREYEIQSKKVNLKDKGGITK